MKLTRIAIAALMAGSLALAASALGEVTVYDNDFSSQGKFREIERSGGGKRCDKKYRQKSKVMLASVKRNPTTCSFRPPVQGDDSLPNHALAVDAKVLKNTSKPVRNSVFIEVTVRAGGGGTGYSFRVFPERKRFELSRGPGGAGFPKSGKSTAIKKVNERNRIELVATGAEIRGIVNGKEVAKIADSNPGQVQGRKVRFALGCRSKKKNKKVVATFKRVAVSVPNP